MTQDGLQDEFIKLRDEAVWLRQTDNTFNCLFDSSPETERILRESADRFFGDLNSLGERTRRLVRQCIVQLMCRDVFVKQLWRL